MIVSFVVYLKTPATANEGLAKLRDAVDNKRLGSFTVDMTGFAHQKKLCKLG